MKNLAYLSFLTCLLFISCKEKLVETADGLRPLSEKWVQDSVLGKNPFIDTLAIETKKYYQLLKNDLTVKKVIYIDSKTKVKTSEADIYTKSLNENIESQLYFSYDYTIKQYHTSFLDTTASTQKRKANQVKLDSLIKMTSETGAYLCGTAYGEILEKYMLNIPIPREIDRDSALFVIEQWVKE